MSKNKTDENKTEGLILGTVSPEKEWLKQNPSKKDKPNVQKKETSKTSK